ncbi:tRNA (guanosine(37)-N1)-methyltransferase TrmD [Micrococcus luteus]|uniref:tRNA (guanosine(37)-N1)-methyltransferase TrmD n=1 Tax=Micrococcus luteus TaxID=1270 RepID=UPI0036974D8C
MRFDVVTIFPEYLAVLDVSLLGRARREGLVDVHVHDLRDFTFDRHRTVDDTPYGGGAGMVMKPEPWALALEHVAAQGPAAPATAEPSSAEPGDRPVLLVPTPSGERFTQRLARELAEREHVAIACGRYEGIDERVFGWAEELFEVRLVSLGDYVLNGGEVAALAMIEAVGRLVPGVVGNPASLVEESHEDGLLEYPVYTKPADWRGRAVPPVLLSGDHGKVAAWRRAQQEERTRERRPDLWAAYGSEA